MPHRAAMSQELRLARRPAGAPRDDDWSIASAPNPTPAPGEFVVEVSHLSLDPAMRGWMDDRPSYLPPVALGAVMRATGVGRVTASRHERFAEGDLVMGSFGVRETALSQGRGVVRIDDEIAPPETWLGLLGGTGLTAYFGLLEVGRPQPGETVVVSAAAGAVGGVVGQLAKIVGCRVIGIAGGPAKGEHIVTDLGFDAAVDYQAEDLDGQLADLVGDDGIDVYFDNVGGHILDTVLPRIAKGARVVVCGAISQYNAESAWRGPSNYWQLLIKSARMEGFTVIDFARRHAEARAQLLAWYATGRLRAREEVVTGPIEHFPDALRRLFAGDNVGKVVLSLQR